MHNCCFKTSLHAVDGHSSQQLGVMVLCSVVGRESFLVGLQSLG
jgi:hypothetical protein